MQFVWENVYAYDKDFRLHMARYPGRNWSLILHQAWALRLRDKLRSGDFGRSGGGQNSNSRRKNHVYCIRYNKTGKCSFGKGCKFEHRCEYCHKFGHPVINCRKLQADRAEKGERWYERAGHDLGGQGNPNSENANVNNNNNGSQHHRNSPAKGRK